MSPAHTPWWAPERFAGKRGFLAARGRMRAALRSWFEAEGFVETECGQLQASPCAEPHLHGFETRLQAPDGAAGRFFLHTSPEFSAKKLLAAGETRLFEFARVFRNREAGRLHAPEFTMLEWYRAHAPYDNVISDTLTLLRLGADAAGATLLRHAGRSCNPFAEADRLTLAQAFARYAEIDLLATLSPNGTPDRAALARAARAAGIVIAEDDSWSDLFTRVMAERIEPHLGDGRPLVLYEYPAPEAALAQRTAHDQRVAERFEVYACGVELANGFGELTDAREQRQRYEEAMALKARLYGENYPIDEDFLAAVAAMPPASGVALGFDRLVMLATDARRIDDVLWTPSPEVAR